MHFGAYIAFNGDCESIANRFRECVRAVSQGAAVRFKTMLTGSDKFTRTKKLTDRGLNALADSLHAREFQAVAIDSGSWYLDASFDWDNSTQSRCQIEFLAPCDDPLQVRELEGRFFEMLRASEAPYGYVIFGVDATSTQSELNGIPVAAWDSPLPREKEDYYFALQRLRPYLGRYVRPDTWGTYLSPQLVQQLGGELRILSGAPVAEIMSVGKGLYLRLLKSPMAISDPSYAVPASQLNKFLVPVMKRE